MPGLWRVFPWDPGAAEGEPFSKTFVPPQQGSGRFDLPGQLAGVLYVAETADHAVAEHLQNTRSPTLEAADLDRWGRRLALARVDLSNAVAARIADLCDPALLAAHAIQPDAVASRDRGTTQGIAQRLFDLRHTGLRWWSAYTGDWHGVVLFREALAPESLVFGTPEPLDLAHPAVRDAAAALGFGALEA